MQRILLTIALSTFFAATAAAQQTASGTIAAMEGNVVLVKTMAGDVIRVEATQQWRGADGVNYRAPNPPSILVSGTEDPKNLRAGHVIQFTATLANRKTVVGEVKDATLLTPTPDARAGILSADPADEAAAPADDKKKPAGMLENCLILGTITRVKSGTVTVSVPGLKSAISFKFAEGSIITVSGNNFSLAAIGDKVTANGTLYAPGRMASQEIKIEHAPIVAEEKPGRRVKPEDVAKPGEKLKPGEKENPFALGDPNEKKPEDPAAPKKPKVKLELIKIN